MNALMEIEIAVLDSLWQAALLAGLAWLVLRFCRNMNAATRFAIWWAVLGAVLILPGAPYVVGTAREWLQPATIQAARPLWAPTAPIAVIEIAPLVTVDHHSAPRWPAYAAAVWGLILLCRLAQLIGGYLHVRGIKNRASVSGESLPPLRRSAALLLSSEIDSPIAVGFAFPAVILPVSLPGRLSREEMEHVLLHETAHLVRWDDWTNLIARMLDAALTLHPVARWILREVEIERERACDEWVVTRTKSAKPYARSLARLYELQFSDHRSALLASGIFNRGSQFSRRIEALLFRGREFTARVSLARVTAGCAALIALAAAASSLPHWIAFAQTPRLSFDVASIKRNTTETEGVTFAAMPGGRLTVVNNPMSNVINNAYGIANYQLTGVPDWVQSERYDIEAKGVETASQKDVMLMTQTLLADRFEMKAHFESREMTAYILTIAKGGSKLHILNPEDCVPFDSTKTDPRAVPNVCGNNLVSRDNGWKATHISMRGVTGLLSRVLRGPVIDRTGIKGSFDVDLQWSDDLEPADKPDAPPGLSSALRETLGLELKSGRGPVDVLVVEHIERPSSN